MKKILLSVILLTVFNSYAQEAYLYSGNNITNYKYKIGKKAFNSNLQSGSGNFYEVGLISPIVNNRIFYSVGVSMNEFNSLGSTLTSSYKWNTRFFGVDSGISFSLFPKKNKINNNVEKDLSKDEKMSSDNDKSNVKKHFRNKSLSFKRFDFLVDIAVNVNTIVYGKQEIDGVYFDLLKENEFSGIFIGSKVGAKLKYLVSPYVSTSLGYSFFQNYNITNSTEEKLSFNTNQVQFGLHFNIN